MTEGPHREFEGFETRAVHQSEGKDPWRALTPPLYMTSTYTFPDMEEVDRVVRGEREGYIYSRGGNPTVRQLERTVALLEGGAAGCAFASGMGAISAVLLSLLKKKKDLVFSRHLYSGTRHFIESILIPLGGSVHYADFRAAEWESRLETLLSRDAGAVFLETPSNPTLDIIDLARVANLCRRFGVPLVVDNTFASPALQNPLANGADIVIHSATKYLGGHGDLLGGVAVGPEDLIRPLLSEEGPLLGATLSPMNAWLILRGLKTLSLRMEAHTLRAEALARILSVHPKVERVFYPGLLTHPGHEIAKRQMKGPGGMLSLLFASGGLARTFMDRLSLVRIGVSLGDPVSLVEHPASMSHRGWSEEDRQGMGIEEGFVRMSVGLESLEDLETDIGCALKAL
jgi:methionine-gamma-lyase